MSEPFGNVVWAPFLIRISLGAYFLMAGLVKVSHLEQFIQVIKGFNVLSANMANVYGSLLPYMELATGGFLLLGLWTTLAGLLASLMLFSFVMAFGVFPESSQIFNKDLVLLSAALSLIFSGPGAYSIDGLRIPKG